MAELAETVLQFGGGKFLRAFADLFIHEANEGGQAVGRVVVVQSTDSERARWINAQRGRYHVLVRGLKDGRKVDRVQESVSLSRALVAAREWEAVLEAGRSPDLRLVVSNTTEAGLALHPGDRPDGGAPRSFPAKLLLVLKARFEAGMPGVTVLPCELVEENADRLRALVLEQARAWGLEGELTAWLEREVFFLNTLVDRIVTGKPAVHPLLDADALLAVAEPFALWAIQAQEGADPLFDHPALLRVPDVGPFLLRKVRILNGAHTALPCRVKHGEVETVREAVAHPEIGPWLRALIFDEIVPVIRERVEDAEGFAEQTLERFANPFLDHRLADIAAYQEAKVKVRLVPTYEEYVRKFGRKPPLLSEVLSGYL